MIRDWDEHEVSGRWRRDGKGVVLRELRTSVTPCFARLSLGFKIASL